MVNGNSGNNVGGGEGRVLNGRYQLIGVVGGGGMAQVYKARDNILGRVVAVKVLRDQYARDEQFVARFKREAQAAANLAHPNIVNVYDVGQDGDCYYIVMENIVGESLKELITRSAPLPVDTAVSIAAQILAGLEYAHRSGLIHRDIKPQNVLITNQGGVKVTDFGIAKSVSDLGLTEAGQALGTVHYFSPEQAKGERVVPQSDIYAVGVSLYEMVTGKLPFESDTAIGLAYKHISEIPKPPSRLNPNIPPRLEAIIMKALAKDPSQRFTSAAEMERALRNLEASGAQATTAIPVARTNVSSTASRQTTGGANRSGRQPTGGSSTVSVQRGGYPAAAGATAGAATRHMASPLAAPTSVAMRGPGARSQTGGVGCVTIGAVILGIGLLAALLALAVWFGPSISSFLSPSGIVPSPTPTPIIPTSTPTRTSTSTPTSTSTITPTSTSTPISVKVPNLVGLKSGDARALATQTGFVIQEADREETVQWPEDTVFQQDPQPDIILKKTSLIRVRVSAGPPPIKLPPLTNTDPDMARTTLEGAGLKVDFAYEGSLNIPRGVVTRSDPPADASVKSGSTVKVYVSMGETSNAPDLTGMTLDLAQQVLAGQGLAMGAVTQVGRAEVGNDIDKVPVGAVYSQDPAKGTVLPKGSTVNIRVRRNE